MARNPGVIYKDSEGQLYIAYNKEQREEFTKAKKLFLKKINVDHTPMLNDRGVQVEVLKNPELLTKVGYVD